MLLKNTKFAFPSLWESPWKFDSVPISSTIGQHIIPKFPFPSFPTEQISTSSDMSAVFSGNLYIDNNKLSIWKLKTHSGFSSASIPSSALFFCLTSVFVSISLPLSATELFTCIPHIQISLYCFLLFSPQSASPSLCLPLSKFSFTVCLSHALFTPSHCAIKSLHTAHVESFLYFYWAIGWSEISRKMLDSIFSTFHVSRIQESFSLLLLLSNFLEVPLSVFPISKSFHYKVFSYTAVKD